MSILIAVVSLATYVFLVFENTSFIQKKTYICLGGQNLTCTVSFGQNASNTVNYSLQKSVCVSSK